MSQIQKRWVKTSSHYYVLKRDLSIDITFASIFVEQYLLSELACYGLMDVYEVAVIAG
jgi:hypothetical protein